LGGYDSAPNQPLFVLKAFYPVPLISKAYRAILQHLGLVYLTDILLPIQIRKVDGSQNTYQGKLNNVCETT